MKKDPTQNRKVWDRPSLPDPLDPFLAQRNPIDDDLASTLLRASESVADVFLGPNAWPQDIDVAQPNPHNAAVPGDYSDLQKLVQQISATLADNPRLAAQLENLPDAFGDGYPLFLLFNSVFGDRKKTPLMRPDGKRYLTPTQAKILDFCVARPSRKEIAEHMGVNENTLGTHFRQIFQRLQVHTQEEAVARAQALGYLTSHDYHNLTLHLGHHQRDIRMFQTLCAAMRQLTPAPGMEQAGPLAQFGLALLLIAGLVGREESGRLHRANSPSEGAIIEMDRSGKLLRRWDLPGIGVIRAMAIAPPAAARHGFTPGNLFAVHDIPQKKLNRGAITEITPDGEVLRTFCGGDDVHTRLIGAFSAAFAPDGRLLVTSGWLTDAILAFSAGGSQVSRFANGTFQSIATSPNQSVLATHMSAVCGSLMAFDTEGKVLDIILPFHRRSEEEHPCGYPVSLMSSWQDVAADSQGRILVTRDGHGEHPAPGRRWIDVLNPCGDYIDTFQLPDYNRCFITTDHEGRIYAPCQHLKRLSVLSASGNMLQHFDLSHDIWPMAIVVTTNDVVVVSGKIFK